jgi:hypothetical protein
MYDINSEFHQEKLKALPEEIREDYIKEIEKRRLRKERFGVDSSAEIV